MYNNRGDKEVSWDKFWYDVRAEEYISKLTLHDRILMKRLLALVALIPEIPGKTVTRVLELGCVYSKNLLLLPQETGSNTVFLGLDTCIGPTVETGRVNPHQNVHVIVGDLFTPPLPKYCIDMIISFGLIEHFPNPQGFLEACWYMLRSGGRLVVGYPSFTGLTGFIQRMVNPLALDYHFSLTVKEMLSRIISVGFNEVEVRYFGNFNPNMIDWGNGWIKKMIMYSAFIGSIPFEWIQRLPGINITSSKFSSYIFATGIKPNNPT